VAYAWTKWPAARVPDVAKTLLGWTVTANGVTIRITETEAYAGVGDDPASHAHRGMTKRNTIMWGPAGYAYIYFNYGMHWMLNIVAGPPGEPCAVLIRAGTVLGGVEIARSRRNGAKDQDLARGPGRLAQALALDKSADGTPVLDGTGPVLLKPPRKATDKALIQSGKRVGLNVGIDAEWRFWLANEASVSEFRPGVRKKRG
jgi:DNA-3-methyladenine glycosylase